jgi:Protein of unknown function (DUF1702)
MLAKLLCWTIHQSLLRRSRKGSRSAGIPENLERVLESFYAGVEAGVGRRSPPAVDAVAARFPWHRRTFFWEGVAFGRAAMHAMTFRRGSPDDRRLTAGYRAVHFTGYGLWNGLARAFPLPKISLAPSRWAGVGDFERYLPVLVGGTAFGTAYFRNRYDRGLLGELGIDDRASARAAVHGFGRALWIFHMEDDGRIGRVLDGEDELRDELLEGLGAAVALTYAGAPEEIASRLSWFPSRDQPPLLRGVGAGLVTLAGEDADNEARLLETIRQPRLLDAWERARRADEQAGKGADWYWNSLELARVPSA